MAELVYARRRSRCDPVLRGITAWITRRADLHDITLWNSEPKGDLFWELSSARYEAEQVRVNALARAAFDFFFVSLMCRFMSRAEDAIAVVKS